MYFLTLKIVYNEDPTKDFNRINKSDRTFFLRTRKRINNLNQKRTVISKSHLEKQDLLDLLRSNLASFFDLLESDELKQQYEACAAISYVLQNGF